MITFRKIKWKNFLSTGNTPIEVNLDQAHTTLIIGKNGSGKSTLLDALCFGLFNKPFRMIKKEQMVNTINNSEAEIEVWFDVGLKSYRILRGIKPNRFEIYCDGEMINQNATTMDYQKYLEKNIMKLNYRSFIQVVILGSSSYEPFMKMKPRYRREVVEEILDIRVFGLMDLLLRSQQSDLQKKITEVRHHADLINTKYETEAKHLKSLQNEDTTTKTHKLSQLDKINKDSSNYSSNIQKLNEDIAVTQSKISDREKVDTKVTQLNKLETKIEQNIDNHKKTLQFFQDNDTCPVCTQKIDEKFKIEKCNHETTTIQKLEEGLLKLTEELNQSYTKVTEFNTLSSKISDMNVEVAKINTSLEGLKRHSDEIDEEIRMLGDKSSDREKVQLELNKLKVSLGEAQVDLEKVLEEKSYVDVCREILNDKGAKAKIIQKYLPIMNTLVNQYLQAMDFFISFHLDEEFNETIKSRHRDSFNYNNFSEGEKMRIDLALLFTWRHIAKMKNSTNTNLLVLDEVFDSSLDGQGTDDFFKIIGKLSKENIFIISHKGDILFDKFTNIIKFEKTQNFTKLETV
jgi:DNA repair exonuclease SbcCD ATPase subunit